GRASVRTRGWCAGTCIGWGAALLASCGSPAPETDEEFRGMDRSLTSGATSRRRFLISAGLLGAAGVLAACSQPAPPAAPTAAPAAPKPTSAPAAAPTVAPTAVPAAAKPTTAPAAPTTAPAAKPTAVPAAAGALKDVPRSRQLLLAQGGTQGKYLDYDLWNGYALGAHHQTRPNLIHEPPAFYKPLGRQAE